MARHLTWIDVILIEVQWLVILIVFGRQKSEKAAEGIARKVGYTPLYHPVTGNIHDAKLLTALVVARTATNPVAASVWPFS
ncbi:hypothetical protein ACFFW8_16995 [Erwinia tracheiphila]